MRWVWQVSFSRLQAVRLSWFSRYAGRWSIEDGLLQFGSFNCSGSSRGRFECSSQFGNDLRLAFGIGNLLGEKGEQMQRLSQVNVPFLCQRIQSLVMLAWLV